MKNTSHEKLRRVLEAISDNREMSDDDIKKDLIANGVNIDAFLSRVKQTVRHGLQAKIKEQMAQAQESRQIKNSPILNEVASWTREKCLEFLDSARRGVSCNHGQQQVALAFRNRQDSEMSDDELRSCIQDIVSLSNEDEK